MLISQRNICLLVMAVAFPQVSRADGRNKTFTSPNFRVILSYKRSKINFEPAHFFVIYGKHVTARNKFIALYKFSSWSLHITQRYRLLCRAVPSADTFERCAADEPVAGFQFWPASAGRQRMWMGNSTQARSSPPCPLTLTTASISILG